MKIRYVADETIVRCLQLNIYDRIQIIWIVEQVILAIYFNGAAVLKIHINLITVFRGLFIWAWNWKEK